MVAPKSHLNVVMGCMTFGEKGTQGARVHDLESVQSIITVFKDHGHVVLDTARSYSGGTCEEYLGKVGWKKQGFQLHTKLHPSASNSIFKTAENIRHNEAGLREYIQKSLDAIQADSFDLFYLHAPDRITPFEETMKAINDLHKEGKFRLFGLSNFMSWEVAEIYTICKNNGYIRPTVYQGVYNGLHREVEPELFPCLKKFGISFNAYNPLAGGMLTGRYTDTESDVEKGARFDESTNQGSQYRKRYWKQAYFDAIKIVADAAKAENISLPETALRWISHHSLMSKDRGDSVIIGGSSLNHIEQNLVDLEKGPLPQSIVDAYDRAWEIVKPDVATYWR